MKKIFSIVFIVGALVSLLCGSIEGTLVSAAGLAIAQSDFTFLRTKEHAFLLTLVPGKFMVQNPGNNNQEVPMMTRTEKSLFDQLITLRRANPVTMDIINQGGISFDPISYYIRANITGASGRLQIVNSSLVTVVGITNIPNNATLPQFYNFCFDRIAVRYATTNSANANLASITGWSSVRSSMPAALGNGHLVVYSNQNKIMETPVSDFTSVAAVTGGGEMDYDGGTMQKSRFFLELIGIEVELAFAQGQVVPSAANNTYAVEVMFYGTQARLKA